MSTFHEIRKTIPSTRLGLSLLEVLLSVAILGGAMVVIANLLGVGYRAAMEARLRTDAALLCDSKMAEVASGAIDLSPVSGEQIDGDPNWVYSVNIDEASQVGLLAVTVTVTQSNTNSSNPVSLSIVRMMPDPDYDPAAEESTE